LGGLAGIRCIYSWYEILFGDDLNIPNLMVMILVTESYKYTENH
jgi:hypothetical protein